MLRFRAFSLFQNWSALFLLKTNIQWLSFRFGCAWAYVALDWNSVHFIIKSSHALIFFFCIYTVWVSSLYRLQSCCWWGGFYPRFVYFCCNIYILLGGFVLIDVALHRNHLNLLCMILNGADRRYLSSLILDGCNSRFFNNLGNELESESVYNV